MSFKQIACALLCAAATAASATGIGVYGQDPILIPSFTDLAAVQTTANDALSTATAASAAGPAATNYANSVVTQVASSNPNAATYEAFRMVLADLYYKYESLANVTAWDNIQDAVDSAVQSAMNSFVSTGSLQTALGGYVPTSRKVNGMDLSADRTLTAASVGAMGTAGTATQMGVADPDEYVSFSTGGASYSYYIDYDTEFSCVGVEARPCFLVLYNETGSSKTVSFENSCYTLGGGRNQPYDLPSYEYAVFQVTKAGGDTYVTQLY